MDDTIQKPKECPRAKGGCQSPITLPFRPNSSAILTNRMRYPARMGLLVLLCLWPQVFINQNLHATPHANPRPAPMVEDDPEQLFVEAMKLAGSGGRANVDQRLDEACLLWTKRGDPERGARARLQVGDLYRDDKRYDESLNQYRQTLLIKGLSPSLKALSYDSMGQIYAELYQTELSLRNYSRALSLARLDKDYAVEAQVQLNLAALSNKTGDFIQAMAQAQSAVISSSKGNDEKVVALSLGFLAQMELKNGLLEKGRTDLDRALSLYRQNNDLPAQIKTLCFSSGLNLSAKQVSLAREQAQSALRIAEDLRRRANTDSQRLRVNALRWPCWLALARAQRASQQREDALKSYLRAVSGTVIDWWMVYTSTERSAIEFAEERQTAYRELVDLLVQLGRIDEAYDAYQDARVRTLSAYIRARHLVGSRSNGDPDNKTGALSASITALRTRLLSPTLNRHQREDLQRELVEVEGDLAERRFQTELNHPKLRSVFSSPARLKQLQNQLGDGESVIEFNLGEERSFVWLISRGTVGFEILPGRGEIEGKVQQYLNDLSTPPTNLHLQLRLAKQRAMAQELFTMLFGKLSSQLASYKLIVIPDGLLNHVPYESLSHNGRYLIEDHEITYLPSASLIELLRQPPPGSASEHDGQLDLLAFGDPVFQQRSKTSLSRNLPASSAKIEKQAGDWETSNLSRLPRTRDEVEYIASLIPKERERLYLGKDSTEKAFKQETLNKYRWIHLATHSLIDERNPGRSAVVLARDGDNDEDGFLRATEIADLDLNCDLVVLSACETGWGRLSSGEGVIGLSRSFFIAGARSVVVSQWAVSDISTAQLMKDFYQQLVNHAAKPSALREARLRMLNGGSETRHPYYWAPFVIIGAP
jgi:CHAT domain-containing protein